MILHIGEEIDEASIKLLDSKTLEILIPKAGPRLKLKKELDNFFKGSCEAASHSDSTVSVIVDQSDFSDVNVLETSEIGYPGQSSSSVISIPLSSSPQSSVSESCKKDIHLKKIVSTKIPEIFKKLESGDPTQINILEKYKLNRLIVEKYIEKYGCQPSTKEKVDLAKCIVNTFPVLKGSSGEGFVSISFPDIYFSFLNFVQMKSIIKIV